MDPYLAHSSDTKAEIDATNLGKDEVVSPVEKTLAQLLLSNQPQLTVSLAPAKNQAKLQRQNITRFLKEYVLPHFRTSVAHIPPRHSLEPEHNGRLMVIKLPHTPSS
jgi:hypothetical protein